MAKPAAKPDTAKVKPPPKVVPGDVSGAAKAAVNQSGAYTPNAHPEFAEPTPIDKVEAWVKAQLSKLENIKKGNKR